MAQLQAEQNEIERELGVKLTWNPNPENRDKIIGVYRNANLQIRDAWPEYLDWMVDMTNRFRKVFMPRIKKLDLKEPLSEEPQQTV